MAKKKAAEETTPETQTEAPPKINKSEAIRLYIGEHPEAKPKAISEALTAQGIKVDATFVSTIRSKMGGNQGTGKKAAGKAAKGGDGLKAIESAHDLIIAAGGLTEARNILDAIGRAATYVSGK